MLARGVCEKQQVREVHTPEDGIPIHPAHKLPEGENRR
jgi:hypothetical protein